MEQVTKDFGVHPITLTMWMRAADVEDGVKPGLTAGASGELREAWRWIRLLKQEHDVLRRVAAYRSQAILPEKGSTHL